MAMTIKLDDLIKLNTSNEDELELKDSSVTGVSISADKRVATIANFGTVDISNGKDKAVIRLSGDFDGTIDLGSASVTKVAALYGATNGKLTYTATNEDKIVGGAGADSISLGAATGELNLGAGNDTVVMGTNENAKVSLGAGVDMVHVAAVATAKGTVADYNFADGDVISVGGSALDLGNFSVLSDGKVSLNGADPGLVINTTKKDGVYAAKFAEGIIDGFAGDVTYFTAAENSGKVNIDATGSAKAIIDATESTGAKIVSGKGDDIVSLSTAAHADTIVIGKLSGFDTVYDFGNDDDVLNFVGGSINDLSYDGTTGVVTFADSKVSLSGAASSDLTANIAIGDADAEKFIFAGTSASLTAVSDVKGYVGKKDNSTVLKVSESVDLTDTAHFVNIANVAVDGNTEAATVIGALKSVDASNAGDTVNVWSTEKDANISLKASTYADTVWIGSGSTEVKLSNFETGFGATADTLVLYDVSDVKDISVNGNVVTAGSAKIEMDGLTDSIAANVVLKGGVAKKIVITDGDVELNKDSLNLDVIATSKKNATLSIDADVTDGGKKDVTINLNDEKYADSFKDVSSASSVGTTNIIGSATVEGATITVTGNGDHNIWAANTGANTITLGGGKNSVWYNAIDGKDTVTGFTADDTVLLYGGEMVGSSAINSAYKITFDGTDVKFASGDSALALEGITGTTFNVMDNAGDTYKVQLADAGELTYDKDTKFYVANSTTATTLNVSGYDASETVALVVNGDAGGNIIAGNVDKINASGTDAKTLLVGSAEATTELIGGKTENYFWGGSKDSDTMVGSLTAFDTFWFGTIDGKDTANNVNADDRVYLYDVNSADINTIAKLYIDESSHSADLSLEGGAAILGINASSVSDFDSIVFRTVDGVDFTYDKESKTFVKKS